MQEMVSYLAGWSVVSGADDHQHLQSLGDVFSGEVGPFDVRNVNGKLCSTCVDRSGWKYLDRVRSGWNYLDRVLSSPQNSLLCDIFFPLVDETAWCSLSFKEDYLILRFQLPYLKDLYAGVFSCNGAGLYTSYLLFWLPSSYFIFFWDAKYFFIRRQRMFSKGGKSQKKAKAVVNCQYFKQI